MSHRCCTHWYQATTEVARELDDERLVDVFEELVDDDRVEIMQALDRERAADVLEEMDPGDAADLISELPSIKPNFFEEMEPGEAKGIRRLMTYDQFSAGGMMTSEPVILPDAAVAEALASIRQADLPPALGAQVFVCRPPTETRPASTSVRVTFSGCFAGHRRL